MLMVCVVASMLMVCVVASMLMVCVVASMLMVCVVASMLMVCVVASMPTHLEQKVLSGSLKGSLEWYCGGTPKGFFQAPFTRVLWKEPLRVL